MVHTHSPTPETIDNYTAYGIVNKNIKQHQLKALDIRFYWFQDQVSQNHFHILWQQGSDNLSD